MGIKVTDPTATRTHYWKPEDTMYIFEFIGKEDTTKKSFDDDTVMVPAWRFNFKVYDFATKAPVIDPETGEQAIYSDRQTQSLNQRSNSYGRLIALLNRDLAPGEDSEDLFNEAIGKRCGGNCAGGWLKTTMRMPAAMLV